MNWSAFFLILGCCSSFGFLACGITFIISVTEGFDWKKSLELTGLAFVVGSVCFALGALLYK